MTRIIHETDAVTIAVSGPYCLGRWRDVPDAMGMRALHTSLLEWAPSVDRFVAINVVDAHAIIRMPEAVRRVVAQIQESFDKKQVGLATVLPAKTFFAAAVRGMVSAVNLMSKASFPQQVFDNVDAAAVWCASRVELHNSAEVVSALAGLERATKKVSGR